MWIKIKKKKATIDDLFGLQTSLTGLQATVKDVEEEKKKLEKQDDDLRPKLVQADKGLSQKRKELYKKRKELSNALDGLASEASYKRKKSQLGTLFIRDNKDLTEILICNDGITYLNLPTDEKGLFLKSLRIKKPKRGSYFQRGVLGFVVSFVVSFFTPVPSLNYDQRLFFMYAVLGVGSALSIAIPTLQYFSKKQSYQIKDTLYHKHYEPKITKDTETIKAALQPIKN